jgi:hypothetical protein
MESTTSRSVEGFVGDGSSTSLRLAFCLQSGLARLRLIAAQDIHTNSVGSAFSLLKRDILRI